MKATITRVTYKNGEEETFLFNTPTIQHWTFYDLQTKGQQAKKNLIRTLKRYIYGDTKDIKNVTIELNGFSDTIIVDLENY